MSEQLALLKAFEFGLEVEQFLHSTIGQYLIACIENDCKAAQDALLTVDPEDPKAIRELQNRAYRAQSISQWLAHAIQEGRNAERLAADED